MNDPTSATPERPDTGGGDPPPSGGSTPAGPGADEPPPDPAPSTSGDPASAGSPTEPAVEAPADEAVTGAAAASAASTTGNPPAEGPAQPPADPAAAGQPGPGWTQPPPQVGQPQWTAQGAWGAPPHGSYPPPGQPPAGYGPYGPPPPGAAGPWPQGAAGPYPPYPPPGPNRTGRGPLWIGIGVVAAILLVVAVVAGVDQLGGGGPDDAVSAAVDDLREWEGITYRGPVRQYGSGDVTLDLTVDRNGDAAGTLSRPDGARAEYARINGVELFKGEAPWWNGDAQEEDSVQRLAGIWLRNPSSEVSLPTQIGGPEKAASELLPPGMSGSSSISVYEEIGTREIAGQPGRLLEGIGRQVIISQGGSPQVLAVYPTRAETPLAVSRAEPAALGVIGERRAVRDTAPEYLKALSEPPRVTTQVLNAAPVCTTSECTATVRVTNTSRFDAQGSLQVFVNGQAADFESIQLGPGQTQDIAVSARNPAASTPGRTVPIRWEAKVNAY